MAFSNGYSMKMEINTDGLGKLYICIAVIWTVLLVPGAFILLRNRQLPYLRIRNIPLALTGVATLHVYLILCFMVYVLQGNFPCQTEYWIMSIYLPLGIALYQASNSQLLHISALQKKFAMADSQEKDEKKALRKRGWRSAMDVVMSYNPTKRTMICIAIGMVLQFTCALVVFMISRKFNQFGIVGSSLPPGEDGREKCRRGWEWWPSIAWQFSWTWLYAPYLLWRVRDISDVHGWRLQTTICCLAGLPASPLWLFGLYLHPMKTFSHYWTPPLWFAPSIMLMQACIVFGPCIQVYKNRRLESETRQIIAEWEHKKKYGTSLSSDSTKVGSKSKYSLKSSRSARSSASSRNGEMYTIAALEKTLQLNPRPLLLFAALKDFSGESISFLRHVSEWKEIWTPPASPKAGFMRKAEPDSRNQALLRREQFTLAVHIYSSFVSLQYSDFPINISSAHLKELEALFDSAAAKINANSKGNAATPFDDTFLTKQPDDLESSLLKDDVSTTISAVSNDSNDGIRASPEKNHYSQVRALKLSDVRQKLPADVQVPDAFGPESFEKAERHVKELVLTNTWPKFVNAGYANSIEKLTLKERLDHWIEDLSDMWSRHVRRRSNFGDV